MAGRLLVVAACALANWLPAPQTTTPVQPGTVTGRVIDESSAPRADAVVELRPATVPFVPGVTTPRPQSVFYLTTADGRFEFRNVPPGRYQVLVARPSAPNPGLSGPASRSVVVEPGQSVAGVELRLPPAQRRSVIRGRVTDERGEPMYGVTVNAMGASASSEPSAGPRAQTDDRGNYAIALDPGRYVVFVAISRQTYDPSVFRGMIKFDDEDLLLPAGPRDASGRFVQSGSPYLTPPAPGADGRTYTYDTTYAPNVRAKALAAVIELAAGSDATGVDIQLAPVRSFRVTGRIVNGGDEPEVVIHVALVRADSPDGPATASMSATSETLVMMDVPEGDYVLSAYRSFGRSDAIGHDALALSARMPVSVHDGATDGWTITLGRGIRVSGTVSYEAPPARPNNVLICLQPLISDAFQRSLGSECGSAINGRFVIDAVAPGRYVVRQNGSSASVLAQLGGVDVADHPLTIGTSAVDGLSVTLAARVPSLSGTYRSNSGPIAGAAIVVFPIDRNDWIDLGSLNRRLLKTTSSADGEFRFAQLPAGNYFVAPLPAAMAAEWPATDVLQSLIMSAVRVSLVDGDAKAVELRSIGGL